MNEKRIVQEGRRCPDGGTRCKTAAPLGIVDIDPAKLRLEENKLNTHTMQL